MQIISIRYWRKKAKPIYRVIDLLTEGYIVFVGYGDWSKILVQELLIMIKSLDQRKQDEISAKWW